MRAVVLLAALSLVGAGCGGSGGKATAAPTSGSTTTAAASKSVSVHAHWVNPPDTFKMVPPCTVTHYTPKTGVCAGTATGEATLTGTWQGKTAYEYGFITNPANLSAFTVLETFTGQVTACGVGTMSYRLVGTVDAAGAIVDSWEILPGFGGGELTGVTGHGTQRGIYAADFSQSGDFSGELACGR